LGDRLACGPTGLTVSLFSGENSHHTYDSALIIVGQNHSPLANPKTKLTRETS
jgi:hypothetical protein